MNKMIFLMLILGLNLSTASSSMAKGKKPKAKTRKVITDDKEPWACVKNNKIIAVKGKTERDRQDRCEEQFGIWEKKRHALQHAK